MSIKKRVSKKRHYMNLAKEVASQSACFRAKHGAIIVKNDHVISTGYVGAPRKTKDCFERNNCLRRELKIPSGQRYEICRSVHSEQNAIINAARSGTSLLDGTIYLYSVAVDDNDNEKILNAYPCFICKKMIINAGLKKMIAYQADGSLKEYDIDNWIKDWQEYDLVDDMEQYGVKTIKENNK